MCRPARRFTLRMRRFTCACWVYAKPLHAYRMEQCGPLFLAEPYDSTLAEPCDLLPHLPLLAPCSPAQIIPKRGNEVLIVSPTVPPRMQRAEWSLRDYAVVEKMYKVGAEWRLGRRRGGGGKVGGGG